MKPALFVASSGESLPLAHAVQANLERDADVSCWDQGVFALGEVTLDVLLEKVAEFDFGVFVFSPDDLMRMRQEQFTAVRDNVLFEFGVFISRLGRKRAFMLVPRNAPSPFHLPSDLAGVTPAEYDAERLQRDQTQAVLGAACQKIRIAMANEWPESEGLTPDLVLLLRYLDRDADKWLLSDRYTQSLAMANNAPEQADENLRRGWGRAVRYGMMLLYREGLVQRRVDTSVTYTISKKGRRLLAAPKLKQKFESAFKHELRPLSGRDW